jgi:hypothetical protein
MTVLGVADACGACHTTLEPLPVNVPTSADHAIVNCSTGVSASVTVAETATASSSVAYCSGSLGPEPATVIELMTGGGLVTGAGATYV